MTQKINTLVSSLLLLAFFIACDKEENTIPEDTPPPVVEDTTTIPDVTEETCVAEETIMRWDSIWIPYEGSPRKSVVEAIKQNKPWKAYGIAYNDYTLNIATSFYDNTETRLAEELIFKHYNKPIGCYPILDLDESPVNNPLNIYMGYISLDHDVVSDLYHVDENAPDNHLEVLEIDSINYLIKGKFACTFIKEPVQDAVYNPDTLRFFNGYFELEFGE